MVVYAECDFDPKTKAFAYGVVDCWDSTITDENGNVIGGYTFSTYLSAGWMVYVYAYIVGDDETTNYAYDKTFRNVPT